MLCVRGGNDEVLLEIVRDLVAPKGWVEGTDQISWVICMSRFVE